MGKLICVTCRPLIKIWEIIIYFGGFFLGSANQSSQGQFGRSKNWNFLEEISYTKLSLKIEDLQSYHKCSPNCKCELANTKICLVMITDAIREGAFITWSALTTQPGKNGHQKFTWLKWTSAYLSDILCCQISWVNWTPNFILTWVSWTPNKIR